MKNIITLLIILLSISLQAQIRMNTKQSFVDSTRLNATGDSLYYYQNGTLINSKSIVASSVSPSFRTLSMGEWYADVSREYHIADGKTVYPSELGYYFAELLQADVLSKTSLILTPTAIATGVVASQKPLSSDGDFTFTRSTSATRVNENGYIEKETQNLILQSNQFDTTWGNSNSTETGGQADKDGGTDAWLLSNSSSGGYIYQSVSDSGVVTISVYAKSGTLNWLRITEYNGANAWFDLQNGVVGSTFSGSNQIDRNIESVGSGWYRCSMTTISGGNSFRLYPATANNDESSTGNIFIQSAQREQGLVARDYIETTTTAIYGGITDNVPRIDYTDKTPSLLLEPQRTNVVDYSELFTGASTWGVVNIGTRTANYGTSPEGGQNSTRLILSNTTDAHIFRNVGGLVDGSDYVFSCWYKGTAGETAYIRAVTSGTNNTSTYKLITFTGDWQREFTTFKGGSSYNYVYPVDARVGGGDNATDFEIYGAQLEEGSYATSYIPTYGTAVTRNADGCIKTNVSHLIGQTEGTIFIKTNDTKLYTDISDSTSSNRIVLYTDTSGYLRNLIVSVDTTSSEIQTSTTIAKGDKIAMAYKGNDVVIYKNGLQISSDTSVTVPSTKQINIGSNYASAISDITDVNNYLLFKTRLSNTELAELTKQ